MVEQLVDDGCDCFDDIEDDVGVQCVMEYWFVYGGIFVDCCSEGIGGYGKVDQED